MFTNKTFWWIVLAAFAAAFGAFFGARYFSAGSAPLPLQSAKLYPIPRVIPPFQLHNTKGASFDTSHLNGRWSLMFFGFTHCPDVCPTTLQEFKSMETLADYQAMPNKPQLIFVSVDPVRDDNVALDSYVKFFSPNLIGLTGDDANLDLLTKSVGAIFVRNLDEGANYSVDHSASVYLFNPEGKLRAMFPSPHRAQQMTADLKAILEAQ